MEIRNIAITPHEIASRWAGLFRTGQVAHVDHPKRNKDRRSISYGARSGGNTLSNF